MFQASIASELLNRSQSSHDTCQYGN